MDPAKLAELKALVTGIRPISEESMTEDQIKARRQAVALYKQGQAALRENRLDEAEKYLLKSLRHNPENHDAAFVLGNVLVLKEPAELHKAIMCYLKALSIKPSFQSAKENLSHLCTRVRALGVRVGVTFASLNDCARCDAYEAAIQEAVSADMTVLDLGASAGGGVLGMVAVKHGAARCLIPLSEGDLTTQSVISQAVAANGLEEQVHLILGDAAPAHPPAQLAVIRLIEAYDMDPLAHRPHAGRSFRAELQHARESGMLAPDARLIPNAIRLMAVCVESDSMLCVDKISSAVELDDLNLSLFDNMRRWQRVVRMHEHDIAAPGSAGLLTEAVVLLQWDLNDGSHAPAAGVPVCVPVTQSGEVHCVVYWYQVQLGGGQWVGNGPDEIGSKHYSQIAAYVGEPVSLVAGSTVELCVDIDRIEHGVSFSVTTAEHSMMAPHSDVSYDDQAYDILPYHFIMINDAERYRAFRDGLALAVGGTPEEAAQKLVLDIGAGSGLLSMSSARLGAGAVVAVEKDQAMARVAQEVIDRNGLTDSISIITEYSKDITVGPTPLTRHADAVVAEVFGDDPLNEGVIATIEHARQHLLVPGGRVVPARIRVFAAAAESAELMSLFRVGTTGEPPLNLDRFNDVAKLRQYVRLRSYDYKLLTEPVVVLDIELEGEDFRTNDFNYEEMPALADGSAQLIVMWYELCFSGSDGQTAHTYSTSPHEETLPWQRAWNQVVFYLGDEGGQSVSVSQGDTVEIHAEYKYDRLWFFFENLTHQKTKMNASRFFKCGNSDNSKV